MIGFGTEFEISVDLIQLLKVITVWGLPYVTVINCLWNSKFVDVVYHL